MPLFLWSIEIKHRIGIVEGAALMYGAIYVDALKAFEWFGPASFSALTGIHTS
jgi:hypothetical protein